MKHFLNFILIWALLILSCGLFYVAVTVTFPSSLINIVSFVSAAVTLVEACGLIDKDNGYGKHNKNDSDESQK